VHQSLQSVMHHCVEFPGRYPFLIANAPAKLVLVVVSYEEATEAVTPFEVPTNYSGDSTQ